MAQFNDKTTDLNVSKKSDTMTSSVNVTTLDKGINNVTLIDYNDAMVRKGSEISSTLAKNEDYSIYGAPSKWILDKEQQYNNCGVEGCLNILATAGLYDIKDQKEDEDKFTQWAITNKFTSAETGEESTYCDDYPPIGVLNLEDGGTVYEQRKEILSHYGIESSSIGGYYEEGYDWYVEQLQNDPVMKNAYDEYILKVDVYNDLVDEYNELVAEGKTEEAMAMMPEVLLASMEVYAYQSALMSLVVDAWNVEFKKTHSDAEILGNIVDAVKNGKGVIAGGDARYLWPDYEVEEYVGHAITLLGVVCDAEDKAVGFYIQDTGNPAVGFAFITTEQLMKFITSNGTDYWNGVIQINVTNDEIKSWADKLSATGNNANNILIGNDNENVLKGMGGNDQLVGNGGNDTLDGGDGNDTLIGGDGDDVLMGGAGNDTYVFSKNCGNDTVDFGVSGSDKLIFTDVAFGDLKYEKSDMDLIITYNEIPSADDPLVVDSVETVTIKDYFKGNNHFLLVDVQDSSGDTKTLQSLITGNIPIEFNEDKATLVHGTFLDDDITAPSTNVYDDTIYGAAGNDTIVTYGGNDLIYGDSFDEENPFVDPTEGETYDDYIEAGLGDDTIYGEAGNNTIVFNANNTIQDGLTTSIVGDGNDVVYSGQGTDALIFKGVKYEDLTITFDGDNLVIKYGMDSANPDSTVTIVDYLKDGNLTSSIKYIVDTDDKRYTIADNLSGFEINGVADTRNELNGSSLSDTITGANFADVINAGKGNDIIQGKEGNDIIDGGDGEDIIDGGDGNDVIYGGNGDDIITGGKGNDKLYGGAGNNQFIFLNDDGNDVIYSGDGNDTIIFKEETKDNLVFINDNEGNLVIRYGNNSELTIKDYFTNNGQSSVTNIIDSAGKNYYIPNLLNDIVMEPNPLYDNDLKGSFLGETINGSDNRDIIHGNGGNDTINGGKGHDEIYGGDGDDVLNGGDGNDELYGEAGNNEIYGGKGNDTINGGDGENRIHFKVGDGNDVVLVGKGVDTIVFDDFEFSKLEYCKDPYSNDLIIRYGNVDADGKYTDSVTIKDYFNTKVKKSIYRIEALYKTGEDEVITREMNFIINDKDTVVKIDSIGTQVNDFTGSIYNDYIEGGDYPEFTGNKYNGGNGNDTIKGGVREDLIYGGNGNDELYGGDDRDTIYGGNGDDTIYGGNGSDYLAGEAGENTFHFEAVENPANDLHLLNNDTIISGKGTDILFFDNVKSDDLEFFQDGNDLIIKYGETDDIKENNSVTIENYFKNKGNVSVKTIKTVEGQDPVTSEDIVKVADLRAYMTDKVLTVMAKQDVKNSLVGSYNDDNMTGGNLDDTLKGGNGNDTILGEDGNDKLYGENGNDAIYGGNGDDYIDGGNGDDLLHGGENDDTIYGGNGNDEIYGDAGDDKLYGVSGTNNFYFASGDGNDTVYAGKGSDVLNFTDAEFADMKFIRSGNDLIIQYNDAGDTVTLANYSKSSSSSIKKLVDKNNATYDIQNDITVLFDGEQGAKNKLSGTYMKDSITGGFYNDTVDGGNGDDTIIGNIGNDSLVGGNGNDIIYGDMETPSGTPGTYDDDDIIRGGNGDDSIYGGYGNDRLYGDAGNNTLYFNQTIFDGNDTVYGGKGYDKLDFKDLVLDDLKFTRSGNNLIITYDNGTNESSVNVANYFKNKTSSVKEIVTTDGNHTILTDSDIFVDIQGNVDAKNKITGTFLNDNIVGGDYNDTLSGGDGNDTIDGGDGNDLIKGGNGNDSIIGGFGNDTLYGDAGDNTYEFSVGSGQDVVYVGNGSDKIKFTDVNEGDITVSRVGNNLVLSYGTDDTVTVANYFKPSGIMNVECEFEDSTTKTLTEIYNASVTPTQMSGVGNVVKGTNNNDEINANDNQTIYAYDGNDKIDTSEKNTIVYAGNGDDTISNRGGNDKFYGEGGTNLIEFETAFGKDTVYGGKGHDILKFWVDFNSLDFVKKGNDLVVTDIGTGSSVTIANYFKNKNSSVKEIWNESGNEKRNILDADSGILVGILGNVNAKNKITGTFLNDNILGGNYNDTLSGGDGNDYIYGRKGDDIIYGGNGNDTIRGGDGNDRLYGEGGNNTFEFYLHEGRDTVYSGKGYDTLDFKDLPPGRYEFEFYNDSKNNLIIKAKDEIGQYVNDVTIANYFKLKGNTSIKEIKDKTNTYYLKEIDGKIALVNKADETQVIQKDILLIGSETSKNKLTGSYLDDSIVGGKANDSLYGGDGNDTIEAGNGNDYINAGNGNDVVYGDFQDLTSLIGGNDKIYGGNGNDTLYGGAGHDSLYGENDNDELHGGLGNDYLDGGKGNDVIYGDAGNDVIRGGDGDDTLYGGAGDDKIYGDAGTNYIHFKSGDDQDIVYSGKGTDTLVFDDVDDFNKLKFQKLNNDLVISYNDTDEYDKVILTGYFKTSSSSVKYIQIGPDVVNTKLLIELLAEDGKYIQMNGLQNRKNSLSGSTYNDSIVGGNLADTISGGNGHDYIEGGNGNDKLYGNDGRDTLLGGDGNDYLDGGVENDLLHGGNGNDTIRGGDSDDEIYGDAGNDRLYGDAGVNTFHFAVGDGNDIVYSGQGHDILDFGSLDLMTDFRFVKNGNDLIVYYGAATGMVDSVTISSYFKGNTSINTIVANYNGEKTTVDIKDFAKIEINGSVNKSNKITGTNTDDVITGGTRNDTLSGGDGEDVIQGGAGNDYISGGRDDDELYGGAGNDTIYGGTGDDTIVGGLDNDKLYGDAGENTFIFRDGDGRDTIYSGSGTDTLEFEGMTVKDLSFEYDKSSGSIIINYGSRSYDYVYIDSFLKNNGITSVKYVVTQDVFDPDVKVTTDLVDLINDKMVDITAFGKKTTDGTSLNDRITSDDKGSVTINGGNGNDSIVGSSFNDTIYGGADNDTIYGNGGSDMIYGGAGDDELHGGDGDYNYLYGDAGNDTIHGDINSKYDYLFGGAGDDEININSKYYTEAYGGEGNDSYSINGIIPAKISDSAGDSDVLSISAQKDKIGIFFNVDNSGNIFAETDTSDLYLYDTTKVLEILEQMKETEQLPTDKLVQIENYFGKGHIEEIKTADTDYFTMEQINAVKQSVTTWLNDKGYMTTEDVLKSGDDALITDMLQQYNVTWLQNP